MRDGAGKVRNFDCVVKLDGMKKRELEMFSKSIVVVKNFDLRVRDDYIETGECSFYGIFLQSDSSQLIHLI